MMRTPLSLTLMTAGLLATLCSSMSVAQTASMQCSTYSWQGDIDHDGYADLVVGVPNQRVDGVVGAGEVHILYGSHTGVSSRDQYFNMNTLGFAAQENAGFGSALALGDFDNDGYNDLAMGEPAAKVGAIQGAGVVVIVYGSEFGLNTADAVKFHQNITGIEDLCETGDFNNDCHADLLIGAPYEDISGLHNAGAVHVLYGTPVGLKSTNSQLWHQRLAAMEGVADDFDRFGLVVAVGDFNGDGYDDAAMSAPGQPPIEYLDSPEPEPWVAVVVMSYGVGEVNILYGSSSRLTATGDQIFSLGGSGGSSDDQFGSALAVGDFDGNGRDDLAIGVHGVDLCTSCDDSTGGPGLDTVEANVGGVVVVYGSSNGLSSSTSRGDQSFTQDAGLEGAMEGGDEFGRSLVAADFDGDGKDDLAIGVPGEDIGEIQNAGAVNVIYGSATGLNTAGNQIWHQNTDDIQGTSERDDTFGFALAAGDYNSDGKDDLAVGVPYDDVDGLDNAGCINIIYGLDDGGSGLDDAYNILWHRNDENISTTAIMNAFFGGSLGSTR